MFKKIFIIIQILLSVFLTAEAKDSKARIPASAPDFCFVNQSCRPYSFSCDFVISNCNDIITNSSDRTDKSLSVIKERLINNGYVPTIEFFRDSNNLLFQRKDSTIEADKMCLVYSEGLRTDCERSRYELSCSDYPAAIIKLPKVEAELIKYMSGNSLKNKVSFGNGIFLFY